jgi:hypothetical protein
VILLTPGIGSAPLAWHQLTKIDHWETYVFKVLILVCSMGIAPQDCDRDNAVDVIVGPEAANELVCGFSGQAYLAGTALAPTDGNYVKIKCTRAASVDRAPAETASDTLAGPPPN